MRLSRTSLAGTGTLVLLPLALGALSVCQAANLTHSGQTISSSVKDDIVSDGKDVLGDTEIGARHSPDKDSNDSVFERRSDSWATSNPLLKFSGADHGSYPSGGSKFDNDVHSAVISAFKVDYSDIKFDGDYKSYTKTYCPPVPEPSTLGLFVAGVSVLGFRAYRKKQTVQ